MSEVGYSRQSAANIITGNLIQAADLNAEFNQLQSAFGASGGHMHDGTAGCGQPIPPAGLNSLTGSSAGLLIANGSNAFGAVTLTGTSNQITITNGTGVAGNPTFSIATGYLGQTSITTLGTVTTGVWNGTIISSAYGGTGINNGASTITLGGSLNTSSTVAISGAVSINGAVTTAGAIVTAGAFTTAGANSLTLTTTGTTNVTLPTTGTLLTNTVTTLSSLTSASSLNTVGTITTGVWNGTSIAVANIVTGTSGANIPLLNGANTWSGVQSHNSGDLVLIGSTSGTTTLNSGAIAGTSIITLPVTTDTLVGKATTDTLTNKTFDTAGTGNIFKINGTQITAIGGNTSTVATVTGALTSGASCVFDASGNIKAGTVNAVVTVHKQVFTSSGTYTPSTGMLYCLVQAVAGGGGGGGASITGGAGGAGGGGGGSFSEILLSAATVSTSQTVTIGAAGSAGTTGGSNGGTGGSTSLGSLLTTNGGVGGTGASSPVSAGSIVTGGAGGAVGTSDISIPGGAGGAAVGFTTNVGLTGAGGGSELGQGTPFIVYTNSAITTGTAASLYGAGGSGGSGTTGGNGAGGAGSKGVMYIIEYCSQ